MADVVFSLLRKKLYFGLIRQLKPQPANFKVSHVPYWQDATLMSGVLIVALLPLSHKAVTA